MTAPVVVTWPGFVGSAGNAVLDEAGVAFAMEPRLGERAPGELERAIAGATAVIASTDAFTADVFRACPELRLVARVGVGYDAIDVAAATAAGVAVCTTPGTNASSVADHALALMLAVLRRVAEHDAAIRAGAWPRGPADLPGELTGRTVGLVGYGRIGRLVARRLRGFDTEVLACDPLYDGGDVASSVDFEELLARCSIVSLHAPLIDATRHLIGAAELRAMRPDAILINTARGGLVDEPALVAALDAGEIAAAGLDVFAEEPPPLERFRDRRDVVLTPHLAGLSDLSRAAMTRMASEAVVDLLQGREPRGILNPEALARR
jgi:phosphoglycerate dehydrogenase-like enzyme